MQNDAPDIHHMVDSIARMGVVPNLLTVVCETTGMGFAAIAQFTGNSWAACAVKDRIHLGVKPGRPIAPLANLISGRRASEGPLVIEHVSQDQRYRGAANSGGYPIESYISVPIILSSGLCFGTLCALDKNPAELATGRAVAVFQEIAALIAYQIETQAIRDRERAAMYDQRAAGELREQFIAILGHDLRSPLQAISAGSELLRRKLTDPLLLGVAARTQSNVRRMSTLIDDVLDFAQGRFRGGIELDVTDVTNVQEGLSGVVQEMVDAHPDRQIICHIDVQCPVRCDLGRLQQVAANLLGNALTHGNHGIPVRFKACADGDDLVIDVWNAGDPISQESIGKIFEPFWGHSTAGNRHGLGLGLHICSQIVRSHRGRMSVTSSKQAGTRFTARLPLGSSMAKQDAA